MFCAADAEETSLQVVGASGEKPNLMYESRRGFAFSKMTLLRWQVEFTRVGEGDLIACSSEDRGWIN